MHRPLGERRVEQALRLVLLAKAARTCSRTCSAICLAALSAAVEQRRTARGTATPSSPVARPTTTPRNVVVLALDPVEVAALPRRAPRRRRAASTNVRVGHQPARDHRGSAAAPARRRARARSPGRRSTSRRSGRRRPTRRARAPAGSPARRARRAPTANSVASAHGVISSPCRTTSRIASPSGVPPGSRVETTSRPSLAEPLDEQPRLRRLARPVLSLEGDEHRTAYSTACAHGRHRRSRLHRLAPRRRPRCPRGRRGDRRRPLRLRPRAT